jgi:hypothetical protein
MIDRGDWNAAVAIANQFSEADKEGATGGTSKEEKEALREAELWMTIAAQKKAEGATDAGASDAAAWAIQRLQFNDQSLSTIQSIGCGEKGPHVILSIQMLHPTRCVYHAGSSRVGGLTPILEPWPS